MKIGLQIPHFDWPGSPHNIGKKLVEIAKTADGAGFSSLWVMDHYKLAILQEHCQRVGRFYDDIERTVLGSIELAPGAMSVNEVVEVCHELAEMGFQHVIYNMPNVHEITPLEILGKEIIPTAAQFK